MFLCKSRKFFLVAIVSNHIGSYPTPMKFNVGSLAGKVAFKNFSIKKVVEDYDYDALIKACKKQREDDAYIRHNSYRFKYAYYALLERKLNARLSYRILELNEKKANSINILKSPRKLPEKYSAMKALKSVNFQLEILSTPEGIENYNWVTSDKAWEELCFKSEVSNILKKETK